MPISMSISTLRQYEAKMIATAAKSAYLLRLQLTSGSLARHLPRFIHSIVPIIMDLCRKLLTRALHYLLMKQHVSSRVLMEMSFG